MRHGWIRGIAAVGIVVIVGPVLSSFAFAGGGTSNPEPPLPDERLGIRTAPILLLSRPDVQADLKLSPEQVQSARKAVTDFYVQASGLRGKTGAQAVAARAAVDHALQAWFEVNLTPDQRKRLVQIDLQWEGPTCLVSREVVADTLVLTQEQRAAIVKAVEERRNARAPGSNVLDDEKAFSIRALTILKPFQRERWKAMLGEPIHFQRQDIASSHPATAPARR